ncbi:EF-hand and coiled-coil domain-containing protein 1-like [Strongylocentrotus purpuratus]|uniref:Uncharacterized protein n=1 Tax=Strongylocentrotus purpuratus TaxID=7668 RepID=A0A7M7T5T6_STRPU|nr:EF-hand and coiled-coil domain-containing protein 1-like [Strongylocentrotus purpuratus]XP_030855976.1 EF-hand and coiled-coil domain-containing protein 1-like [Strongylocentrotus purpuratus]
MYQEASINNEIVVLSTGIDQYIQEVFFHLGNRNRIIGTNRDDAEPETISSDDFKNLCLLLGADDDSVNEESGLEGHDDGIEFQDFHSRLIDMFAEINDEDCKVEDEGKRRGDQNRWRSDDEMVEAGINVPDRQGLVLRQMCTECFQYRSVLEVFHSVLYKQGKTPIFKDGDNREHLDIHTANNSEREDSMSILAGNEEVAILRAENNCLREVVEDMRRALQSCDAKCLALLVEIKKFHQSNGNHLLIDNYNKQKMGLGSGETESTRVVKLVKEINMLRENRDKQLEEAILFTQHLEAELWQERQKNEVTEKCDKG